jgi:hypothetical protein
VVISVPAPLTSMAPPSSTTSRPRWRTGRRGSASLAAARSGIWSSRFQSGYFAQALNRKRAMPTCPAPSPSRVKIGPKSRAQIRLVGKRRKLTRSRSTPMCANTRRALVSWAASFTSSSTRSPEVSFFTMSP